MAFMSTERGKAMTVGIRNKWKFPETPLYGVIKENQGSRPPGRPAFQEFSNNDLKFDEYVRSKTK